MVLADHSTAREAASAALAVFQEPDNAARLKTKQAECEGDIAKFFQTCIPLATEILGSVIQKYGFEPTQNGCVQFTTELSKFAGDPEIAALVDQLKKHFMPGA